MFLYFQKRIFLLVQQTFITEKNGKQFSDFNVNFFFVVSLFYEKGEISINIKNINLNLNNITFIKRFF